MLTDRVGDRAAAHTLERLRRVKGRTRFSRCSGDSVAHRSLVDNFRDSLVQFVLLLFFVEQLERVAHVDARHHSSLCSLRLRDRGLLLRRALEL